MSKRSHQQALPLVVLVDTREQTPYRFDPEVHGAECRTVTLETGDYSVVGAEHRVCVERKGSVSDLASCVGRDRERFERELLRMKRFERRFLLMEFTLQEMLSWAPPQGWPEDGRHLHGTHLVGSVLAWAGRYQLQPLWCGSRALAAATLLKLLRFAVKDQQEIEQKQAEHTNSSRRKRA